MRRMERNLSIQVVMLPKDTNGNGTIFGGVILSQIDLAAAVEAARHTRHRIATVAMREVEFHRPVHVGDVVSFYTRLERVGNTSLTIHVDVEALRWGTREPVQVTEAEVIFVAVDRNGDKVPVRSEPEPRERRRQPARPWEGARGDRASEAGSTPDAGAERGAEASGGGGGASAPGAGEAAP
jgi:acyl-CoA thioesterase YciA